MSRTLGDAQIMTTRLRQVSEAGISSFFNSPGSGSPFLSLPFPRGQALPSPSSRPGTFSAEDLAQYCAAWSQPGAMTSMIHWYRALFRYPPNSPTAPFAFPRESYGANADAFLLPEMAHESQRYCTDAELYTFANASHWLQHEEPARVSELLIDFSANRLALSAVPARASSDFYSNWKQHNFRTGSEAQRRPPRPRPAGCVTPASSNPAESVSKLPVDSPRHPRPGKNWPTCV